MGENEQGDYGAGIVEVGDSAGGSVSTGASVMAGASGIETAVVVSVMPNSEGARFKPSVANAATSASVTPIVCPSTSQTMHVFVSFERIATIIPFSSVDTLSAIAVAGNSMSIAVGPANKKEIVPRDSPYQGPNVPMVSAGVSEILV